ncbi:GMP synthase (glutamine-hydrolysing) [Mumia flava]|uniref:GMP synthase (Glutamine-hydrolysing) n=1 Tax=Mumia flava TaxID=1348852 RepID=A0A2M9BI65_9ACTN|nr:glutamine amidotransferase [Mumia flava]PJJ57630.1 GMP synthase (glutamine-hydrolysing) [Mumia flava]
MKPFLLLSIRADDAAADDEYAAFLRFSGLEPSDLHRHRLDRDPLPPFDLEAFAGIVLGGGPYNASDPEHQKSPAQRRAEEDLALLLDRVVAADFPFLGACYGIGALGTHQGAVVDRTYAEPIGSVPITLTEDGCADGVFGVLPRRFDAFVGHKEAITSLPPHAVRLAGSAACPVQAFRVGRHVYATQFHPELDVDGLCLRIETYRHAGYFDPSEVDALLAVARSSVVMHPTDVLPRFVQVARARSALLQEPASSRRLGG